MTTADHLCLRKEIEQILKAKTLAFLTIHPIYYSENNCSILTSVSSNLTYVKTSPETERSPTYSNSMN